VCLSVLFFFFFFFESVLDKYYNYSISLIGKSTILLFSTLILMVNEPPFFSSLASLDTPTMLPCILHIHFLSSSRTAKITFITPLPLERDRFLTNGPVDPSMHSSLLLLLPVLTIHAGPRVFLLHALGNGLPSR